MNWVFTGVPTSLLTTLGLGLGAAIVTLYLLRVRRRRVQVPYAELWRRVLDERVPTRWKERLRRLLSLLVQLLILALILLALADPRTDDETQPGRSVVLVVDTSASMAALDEAGARTRIERAREAALALLDSIGPRDELLIVRMDAQVTPLTPFTKDHDLTEEILRSIDATATGARLADAVSFAMDALDGRARGEVVLVTDGAFSEAERERAAAQLRPGVSVQHVPIGVRDENLAITAFNVRRYPANRTNYEVFLEVRSFSDEAVTVEIELRGGGNLIDLQRIDLGPRAIEQRVWPDLPAGGRQLEATVKVVAGDLVDVLPLDDTAYALLPEDRAPRVLLVTRGNLYLEGPFLLNESFDTTITTPEAYMAGAGGDPSAEYDLTIFDGVTPPVAERGNFFYLGPSGEFSPWPIRGDVSTPIMHTSDTSHPLLRWITGLRDVNVATARSLATTREDRVIASAIGGQPMIVVRDTPRGRVGALAFEPTQSDLPLRVAFPILLINAVDWFTDADRALVDSFATGSSWPIGISDRDVTEVTLVSPTGREQVVPAYDGTAVFYGDVPGFWTLRAGEAERQLAANLANIDESDVGPNALDTLPGITTAPAFLASSRPLDREPWMLLLLAVVALLALEWFTWNRRITV